MKQFWAFIKIEFFHIFRDRRTMLILLGMPVLQIILFGFAITTELNHSRVAVLDPSKDAVTTRITERIDENRYFSVVKELSSASDIETVFRHDEADIVWPSLRISMPICRRERQAYNWWWMPRIRTRAT